MTEHERTREASRPRSDAIRALEGARYVSLETYKTDGTPVRVPVWIVRSGGALSVWTNPHTYKAKRLRKNPKLRVAPCSANGKRILGEWVEGTAKVVEDAAVVRDAEHDLRGKYGFPVSVIRFINRFRGKTTYCLLVLDV